VAADLKSGGSQRGRLQSAPDGVELYECIARQLRGVKLKLKLDRKRTPLRRVSFRGCFAA
jgi:hypothetical protein